MDKYKDCVLRLDLHGMYEGQFICHGLTECLCETKGRCPFYASSKTHYRDKKTGYIYKKKRGYKNEKIDI